MPLLSRCLPGTLTLIQLKTNPLFILTWQKNQHHTYNSTDFRRYQKSI